MAKKDPKANVDERMKNSNSPRDRMTRAAEAVLENLEVQVAEYAGKSADEIRADLAQVLADGRRDLPAIVEAAFKGK